MGRISDLSDIRKKQENGGGQKREGNINRILG